MKRLLAGLILFLPLSVFGSSHMDVIELQLKDGCSLTDFLDIRADFNKWGADFGYQAEVAVPLQSDSLEHIFWLGSSANAATYGKAWDTWRDALADPVSEPSKLAARFQDCSENISRRGYDIY